MEQKQGPLVQFNLSIENDNKMEKYQALCILEGSRLNKGAVINKALEEFFKYNLDDRIEIRKESNGK